MRPERSSDDIQEKRIPAIVAFFFIADVALLALYLANQAVGAPFDKPTRLLSLNDESSISSWYSAIQLAFVAVLAGLFAFRNIKADRISTWALLLLPLVFIALSMDESVQIHEWLGKKSDVFLPGHNRGNTPFPVTGIWMFLFGIPFMAAFFGIIFILRRYLKTVPGVFTKLLLGLAIMITGAIFIEILSNFVKHGSLWYHLELVLEEGFEMLGVTIILWAFYDLLLGHGFYIHLEPLET